LAGRYFEGDGPTAFIDYCMDFRRSTATGAADRL
jgi:hypothetical protein